MIATTTLYLETRKARKALQDRVGEDCNGRSNPLPSSFDEYAQKTDLIKKSIAELNISERMYLRSLYYWIHDNEGDSEKTDSASSFEKIIEELDIARKAIADTVDAINKFSLILNKNYLSDVNRSQLKEELGIDFLRKTKKLYYGLNSTSYKRFITTAKRLTAKFKESPLIPYLYKTPMDTTWEEEIARLDDQTIPEKERRKRFIAIADHIIAEHFIATVKYLKRLAIKKTGNGNFSFAKFDWERDTNYRNRIYNNSSLSLFRKLFEEAEGLERAARRSLIKEIQEEEEKEDKGIPPAYYWINGKLDYFPGVPKKPIVNPRPNGDLYHLNLTINDKLEEIVYTPDLSFDNSPSSNKWSRPFDVLLGLAREEFEKMQLMRQIDVTENTLSVQCPILATEEYSGAQLVDGSCYQPYIYVQKPN